MNKPAELEMAELENVTAHSCSKSHEMRPDTANCLHFYVNYEHSPLRETDHSLVGNVAKYRKHFTTCKYMRTLLTSRLPLVITYYVAA